MASITLPNTFTAGTTILSAAVNSNFTTIYNDYNNNITNINIAAAAAIVDTKLAQLTTASKVNLTALVITSQAQGDIIYASSASVLARLGAGTSGQALTTGGAAANPAWAGMTTRGDIEYMGATTRSRLAVGTASQVIIGGTDPSWAGPPLAAATIAAQATGDIIYASSATAWSRLAVGTASQVLIGGTTPSWAGPPLASATIAAQATGDIIYASSATVWARLAVGTATQLLHGGTTPAYSALVSADMPSGTVVQMLNTITGTLATGTTALPFDNTIPQSTEGDQYMSLAITPKNTNNKLKIEVVVFGTNSGNGMSTVALFQDATANALACGGSNVNIVSYMHCIKFTHWMTAGTTSATTFKVRAGGASGTFTFNGEAGAGLFGGVLASSITITEIV